MVIETMPMLSALRFVHVLHQPFMVDGHWNWDSISNAPSGSAGYISLLWLMVIETQKPERAWQDVVTSAFYGWWSLKPYCTCGRSRIFHRRYISLLWLTVIETEIERMLAVEAEGYISPLWLMVIETDIHRSRLLAVHRVTSAVLSWWSLKLNDHSLITVSVTLHQLFKADGHWNWLGSGYNWYSTRVTSAV